MKQNSPRWDAAFCGVTYGAILFAYVPLKRTPVLYGLKWLTGHGIATKRVYDVCFHFIRTYNVRNGKWGNGNCGMKDEYKSLNCLFRPSGIFQISFLNF